MVDEYGHSARQPLAVAEVQGYAYAALQAAALLLTDRTEVLTARAKALLTKYGLPQQLVRPKSES